MTVKLLRNSDREIIKQPEGEKRIHREKEREMMADLSPKTMQIRGEVTKFFSSHEGCGISVPRPGGIEPWGHGSEGPEYELVGHQGTPLNIFKL